MIKIQHNEKYATIDLDFNEYEITYKDYDGHYVTVRGLHAPNAEEAEEQARLALDEHITDSHMYTISTITRRK